MQSVSDGSRIGGCNAIDAWFIVALADWMSDSVGEVLNETKFVTKTVGCTVQDY